MLQTRGIAHSDELKPEPSPRAKAPVSPEQADFVNALVRKHAGAVGGFQLTVTTPFRRAFRELDDIHTLFEPRGKVRNALKRQARAKVRGRLEARHNARKQKMLEQGKAKPLSPPEKAQDERGQRAVRI